MMRSTFIIIALGLSLLDILYTYTNVKILKENKKNWEESEYNPLVRTSWHIYGLLKGSFLAGSITLAAVLAIAYMIGENEFFQGVMIGMFLMLHHVHYLNYAHIRKKYLGKDASWPYKILMEW